MPTQEARNPWEHTQSDQFTEQHRENEPAQSAPFEKALNLFEEDAEQSGLNYFSSQPDSPKQTIASSLFEPEPAVEE